MKLKKSRWYNLRGSYMQAKFKEVMTLKGDTILFITFKNILMICDLGCLIYFKSQKKYVLISTATEAINAFILIPNPKQIPA